MHVHVLCQHVRMCKNISVSDLMECNIIVETKGFKHLNGNTLTRLRQ